MYIPNHFQNNDTEVVLEIVRELKFGIIISTNNNIPIATHIPLDLITDPNRSHYLWGHIAKANKQWHTFSENKILVIFNTPSAYISPVWYDHINVPTSNYISVHIYGSIKIVEDKNELINLLAYSVSLREKLNNTEYSLAKLSKKFLDSNIEGLVGFKISIEEILPNFKLSQNRNSSDFSNIISKLKMGNSNDIYIADKMDTVKKTNNLVRVNSELLFKIAENDTEKNEIYESRYSIAKELYPFLFTSKINGHVSEDIFDKYSYLFYCKDKSVIGSCRVTPYSNNKWEISDSLPEEISLNFDTKITLQLNRVYVEENYRNRAIHEFMFYYFSLWVMEKTCFTSYFAVCNAGLVRMYQNLGAKLIYPDGFYLTGRLSHKYYLVSGNINEFNSIIKNKYSL